MKNRAQGFVLVNALVIVMAISGVALVLMTRAEHARARQAHTQTAGQITLYLDAFETLGRALLAADARSGDNIDHLSESWAQAQYDVALDRGEVAGAFIDLQGRFNINWLARRGDPQARAAFDALLLGLGVSRSIGDEIAAFVSADGPSSPQRFTRANPPIAPIGGQILMVDQLLSIPTLTDRDYARLRPYIAALPAETRLNVNTAPKPVLEAMIPGLGPAQSARLIAERSKTPFESDTDFQARLQGTGRTDLLDDDALALFGVDSAWFGANVRARLSGQVRHRRIVFHRQPLPQGVVVAYRVNQAP